MVIVITRLLLTKSDTILNYWRYLVEDYDASPNFYKKAYGVSINFSMAHTVQ